MLHVGRGGRHLRILLAHKLRVDHLSTRAHICPLRGPSVISHVRCHLPPVQRIAAIPREIIHQEHHEQQQACPGPVGANTYKYSSAWVWSPPVTASSAVAPPGGWAVFVSSIRCHGSVQDVPADPGK